MTMNPFLREESFYQQESDYLNDAMKQSAFYLAKRTGKPIADVERYLRAKLKQEGDLKYSPPRCAITVRDERTQDRRIEETNVANLFQTAKDRKLIRAPSLTFFLPPEVKRSVLADFIDHNVALRATVKQEMFAARGKDKTLESNKKNEQNSLKTRNNACSGAHSSKGTILHNQSTHSVLTSICRSATSYGNANNEKLLGGSRHYYNPSVVIYNITSICNLIDFVAFEEIVQRYNFYMPSTKDVMECIEYGILHIWSSGQALARIESYVDTLTPIEKAAFLYIGDLYHIRKHNPDFIHSYLKGYIEVTQVSLPKEEWKSVETIMDGDLRSFVSLLRSDITKGTNFKDLKVEDENAYGILMSTVNIVHSNTLKYKDFIREMLTTKCVPGSIARLPEVVRRISMVSDTDSTMATAQEWSEWFAGEGNVNSKLGNDIGDTMIYVATQNIAHMMARMSANMGVTGKQIFRYSMKNEYKFGAFSLTNSAKHYFSVMASQEGATYPVPKLEVKGVGLRSSNMPVDIMSDFHKTLHAISCTVMKGEKIKLQPILQRVSNYEHSIIDELLSGGFTHLRSGNTKGEDGYTNPLSSAYFHHLMWEECFAAKYGSPGLPPYRHRKIKITLSNKTAIKEWLESITDPAMKFRLQGFFAKYKKAKIESLLLPEPILEQIGIPEEIVPLINIREAAFSSVEPFYVLFDSLGLGLIDKKRSRLLSDYYPASTSSKTGE